MLAIGPLAIPGDDAEARKRGKQKRRNGKRNKKHNKPKTRADATCAASGGGDTPAPSCCDNRFAQTFTPRASGQLLRAELALVGGGAAAADFIVRIAPVDGSGIPTNDVLVEASVASASVSNVLSTVAFTFTNPAAVEAGTTYGLVLTRPGSDIFAWAVRDLNACDGRSFVSFSQSDTFQFTSEQSDFIFTTFVRS